MFVFYYTIFELYACNECIRWKSPVCLSVSPSVYLLKAIVVSVSVNFNWVLISCTEFVAKINFNTYRST
jgi:hypothetical protein